MITLIFLILFLVCACFTMFVAWRFENEKIQDISIKLSIAFVAATAITFMAEIF